MERVVQARHDLFLGDDHGLVADMLETVSIDHFQRKLFHVASFGVCPLVLLLLSLVAASGVFEGSTFGLRRAVPCHLEDSPELSTTKLADHFKLTAASPKDTKYEHRVMGGIGRFINGSANFL